MCPETGIADYSKPFGRDVSADDIDAALNPNPIFVSQSMEIKPLRNKELADYQCEAILQQIKDFQNSLDDAHEVLVQLASFGHSIQLSVSRIRYQNPSLLIFDGFIGKEYASLIQHVSQLNFLLLAVQKADPEKPANRIGFEMPSDVQDHQ